MTTATPRRRMLPDDVVRELQSILETDSVFHRVWVGSDVIASASFVAGAVAMSLHEKGVAVDVDRVLIVVETQLMRDIINGERRR